MSGRLDLILRPWERWLSGAGWSEAHAQRSHLSQALRLSVRYRSRAGLPNLGTISVNTLSIYIGIRLMQNDIDCSTGLALSVVALETKPHLQMPFVISSRILSGCFRLRHTVAVMAENRVYTFPRFLIYTT